MTRSLKRLGAFTLSLALASTLATTAANALPIRGTFSGVIASERNPDFTPRYGVGDEWRLSFQFQESATPQFVGSDFADYSLSAFNFVALTLNGFTTRPSGNGFALRVREDTFSIFGPVLTSTFPSPFTRSGFYDFFIQVEGPGISTDFTDLTTLNPDAINAATPFPRLFVDGEGPGTFGGSTEALLTLNNTSVTRILPPPPPPPVSMVPVPAAGLLLGSLLGLGAMFSAWRRRFA